MKTAEINEMRNWAEQDILEYKHDLNDKVIALCDELEKALAKIKTLEIRLALQKPVTPYSEIIERVKKYPTRLVKRPDIQHWILEPVDGKGVTRSRMGADKER